MRTVKFDEFCRIFCDICQYTKYRVIFKRYCVLYCAEIGIFILIICKIEKVSTYIIIVDNATSPGTG